LNTEEFYGRKQLEINFHESQKLQNLTITELAVNSIIYIVGLVVVIVAVLSFFGLR